MDKYYKPEHMQKEILQTKMRRKCDIILIVVIKEVRGYEKPEPTAWLLFRTQGDRCCFAA